MKLMLGELPPTAHAEVETHLDSCPSCRRMVADALRAQTPEGPPGDETQLTPGPLLLRAPMEEPPLEKGTAVGRYRVLERLGAGSMGVVYSAHDPELDRRVALKLRRARVLGLDAEQARGRLLHEAQALALRWPPGGCLTCMSTQKTQPMSRRGRGGACRFAKAA